MAGYPYYFIKQGAVDERRSDLPGYQAAIRANHGGAFYIENKIVFGVDMYAPDADGNVTVRLTAYTKPPYLDDAMKQISEVVFNSLKTASNATGVKVQLVKAYPDEEHDQTQRIS